MKKLMSVLLALVLVLAMVPVAASAESTELPTPVDGVITLTEDVTLTETLSVLSDQVIDLNGWTLNVSRLDVNPGVSLTVQDTSEEQDGKITSSNAQTVVVWDTGTFTLESGTIENTASEDGITIFNLGKFTINNGRMTGETVIYNTARNGDTVMQGNIECNINGGTIETTNGWAVVALGLGLDENGDVNNSKVTINIADGQIIVNEDGQGIATNASSGAYAGFTINMVGGTIDAGENGCGMYLPAIGVTNISDGAITGNQGIRIAAGDLNITGGTITGNASMSDNTDLISGGSGGTEGAIVVGKASGGYVGNVNVHISGDAVVTNTAEGEGTKPAIVVSDKNMSNDSMGYDDLAITVTVDGTEGAEISGDVVKVSNLTTGANTQDGGNTSLTISNTTVDGNVTNQSKTGLTIRDTNITGNVSNTSEGSTAILGDSKVEQINEATGSGTIFVENAQGEETEIVAINETTAVTYTDLAAAISEAKDGDTIRLVKDFTLDAPETGISSGQGAVNITKDITLDGNGKTITAGEHYVLNSGDTRGEYHVINVMDGANVIIRDLTIDGGVTGEVSSTTGSAPRSGINVFTANGSENNPTTVTLENVEVKNCSTYGVTSLGSNLTVNGLTTSGNLWGGINLDNSTSSAIGGTFTMTDGDIGEENSLYIENSKGNEDGQDASISGGIFAGSVSVAKQQDGTTDVNGVDLSISGGTYENNISDYLDGNLVWNPVTGEVGTPSTPGGTPTEPEEPTWPFTDVTEGDDWFYDAVAYVYENNIMAGTDETTFEPTMELDRAMAAQLFYNLEGKPAVTGDSTFSDVTSGHWAVDAITWAAQNDIVAGIGGGLYDPDSNVTREQFAVMLYKYARFKSYDLTATGDLTQFPDAGSISSWAETALSWANGKGLINGHENGTIDPKGSTIRAQAASIMANFDQNVAK